jgi:hypothetical protein
MFTLVGFGRATRPFAARIFLFVLEPPPPPAHQLFVFYSRCCSASRGMNDKQYRENPQKIWEINLPSIAPRNRYIHCIQSQQTTSYVKYTLIFLKLFASISYSSSSHFPFFYVFLFTLIPSLHLSLFFNYPF